MAEGYQPRFLDAVDPLRGVVQFQLALRAPVSSEEGRVLYGRVIGPEGRLVVGATVNVEGVRKGRGTTWGRIDYVDPLSVTNELGLFRTVPSIAPVTNFLPSMLNAADIIRNGGAGTIFVGTGSLRS